MKAILIDKQEDKQTVQYTDIDESQLPDGNVLIKVDYSTLNYKDSLAITGKAPIAKIYPLVPGIDLAGTVEDSQHPSYKEGDKVVLNGWGVGENHWGGLAEKASLNGDWLVPLPEVFSPRQAMGIGTAGYTAMLCVNGLENQGVRPDQGEIIVTGSTGGVGSVAISLLSKLGYDVVAVTGRPEHEDYLKSLGAKSLLDRAELAEPGRPLGKERWAGAVDVVGSHTLVNICAQTKYGGTVTACGLAQGFDFKATVMPFILRGVKLVGIESVYRPTEERIAAWERLAELLPPETIDAMIDDVPLSGAIEMAHKQIDGTAKGRIVVDVSK